MSFLSKLFDRKKEPERFLQSIQIEVCTACNATCTFCPAGTVKRPDGPQFLTPALYEKLLPSFAWTRWVYFGGWGEPFLHPDLWQMIRLAKQQGTKVALTTNGSYLTGENIDALFDTGVDLLAVSLAGAEPATHNRLRRNTDLAQILAAIRRIAGEKKSRKKKQPALKVVYMLTKDTVSELLQAVKTAYELGVNEFHCTHLSYVFSPESDDCKLFSYAGSPHPAWEEAIVAARRFAHAKNYIFDHSPLVAREQLACCEPNPANSLFITAGGEVTCCPYLARPANPRYFQDEVRTFPRKSFGNLHHNTLAEIWDNRDYLAFRRTYGARSAAYRELLEIWGDSDPSLIVFQEAERQYDAALKAHPLPPECGTCPKIYGF